MKSRNLIGLVLVVSFGLSGCNLLQPAVSQDELSFTPENSSDSTPATTSNENSKLIDYSEANLASAAEDGTALLFFHATWCTTCRAAEKEITEKMDELPEDLTILKANFDRERELKKQYSVVSQHTFVQVDKDGELVTKWSGGGVAAIVSQIKTI